MTKREKAGLAWTILNAIVCISLVVDAVILGVEGRYSEATLALAWVILLKMPFDGWHS